MYAKPPSVSTCDESDLPFDGNSYNIRSVKYPELCLKFPDNPNNNTPVQVCDCMTIENAGWSFHKNYDEATPGGFFIQEIRSGFGIARFNTSSGNELLVGVDNLSTASIWKINFGENATDGCGMQAADSNGLMHPAGVFITFHGPEGNPTTLESFQEGSAGWFFEKLNV